MGFSKTDDFSIFSWKSQNAKTFKGPIMFLLNLIFNIIGKAIRLVLNILVVTGLVCVVYALLTAYGIIPAGVL